VSLKRPVEPRSSTQLEKRASMLLLESKRLALSVQSDYLQVCAVHPRATDSTSAYVCFA